MSFIDKVEQFADYRAKVKLDLDSVTVAVTPKYARKKLCIGKDDPLVYKGLTLRCIGSKRWRESQWLQAKRQVKA